MTIKKVKLNQNVEEITTLKCDTCKDTCKNAADKYAAIIWKSFTIHYKKLQGKKACLHRWSLHGN